jgi:hypothetical protein
MGHQAADVPFSSGMTYGFTPTPPFNAAYQAFVDRQFLSANVYLSNIRSMNISDGIMLFFYARVSKATPDLRK